MSAEIVYLLAELYPKACSLQDADGKTPLCLAIEVQLLLMSLCNLLGITIPNAV